MKTNCIFRLVLLLLTIPTFGRVPNDSLNTALYQKVELKSTEVIQLVEKITQEIPTQKISFQEKKIELKKIYLNISNANELEVIQKENNKSRNLKDNADISYTTFKMLINKAEIEIESIENEINNYSQKYKTPSISHIVDKINKIKEKLSKAKDFDRNLLGSLSEIHNLNIKNARIHDSLSFIKSSYGEILLDSLQRLTNKYDEQKDETQIATIQLRESVIPIEVFTQKREVKRKRLSTPIVQTKTFEVDSVSILISNGIIQEILAYGKINKIPIIFENTRNYSISTKEAFKQFRTGIGRRNPGKNQRRDWKNKFFYLEYKTNIDSSFTWAYLHIPELLDIKREAKLESRTYIPKNGKLPTIKKENSISVFSKNSKTSLDLRSYSDLLGLNKESKNNLLNLELAATFVGSTVPLGRQGKTFWLKKFTPYFKYHLQKDDERLHFNSWELYDSTITTINPVDSSTSMLDTTMIAIKDSFKVFKIDALNNRSVDIGFKMTYFHLQNKIHTFELNASAGVMMGSFYIVDSILNKTKIENNEEGEEYDTTAYTLYNPYFHTGFNWRFNATSFLSFDLGAGLYPFVGIFEPKDWNGIDLSSKLDDELFVPIDISWQINFTNIKTADFFLRAKYISQLRTKKETSDEFYQDALGRLKLEVGFKTTVNNFFGYFLK